ncbi:MAG TPA: aromatic acid exporter family protein [Lactobacillaceae bacterium]
MHFGRFRLGLRTIKTTAAVMLIFLVFYLTNRGTPFIAALAAIFALREDFESTVSFGKIRVMSNLFGGGLAVIYFVTNQALHNNPWVTIILLPLLLLFSIVVLDGFNLNQGIIGASAALLMIALTIPAGETIFYVLNRVLDTVIGVAIAIAINRFATPD